MASSTYSPRLSDNDYNPSGNTNSVPISLSSVHEKHNDGDELNVQPAKKKRGRPPLDDDFESYSTPKISHVESTANNSNYKDPILNPLDTMNDDVGVREMHIHSNSMLEQNMEIQIDNDDVALHGQIVPKTERPDTPPSSFKPDYYDDDDIPASPMDDPNDASTSQVH